MADFVLVSLHAGYIHPPFGLYCLRAALGALRERCVVLDFSQKDPGEVVAEAIAAHRPQLIGLSVFLWNHEAFFALIPLLRQRLPEARLVGGGPEVTGLSVDSPLRLALDHVIEGPGEEAWRTLCEQTLGTGAGPGLPNDPYEEYTDEDLAHRLTYVEASRGCAFRCSFCTSAGSAVVPLPLGPFLDSLGRLLDRGAHRIKFLDRSFNLDIDRACAILDWVLDRPEFRERGSRFIHCELVPDRIPEALRSRLRRFLPGTLRLEVGVQTLDAAVSAGLQRPLNVPKVLENLRFLVLETQAIVHLDLIAGLPGEGWEGFAQNVDTLWGLVSHRGGEVQLGILKRLPGTPLDQNPPPGATFRPTAPYDVLSSPDLDEDQLVRLGHAARLWERVVNRLPFPQETRDLLGPPTGAFDRFEAFSRWLVARHGRSWGLARDELGRGLREFLALRHT